MRKKYSKKAQLRQWWKRIKEQYRWHGFCGTIWRELTSLYPFRKIDQFYWFCYYVNKPFNVLKITSIPRSYQDIVEVMLHANFQLLVNFVEKESPFEYGDWEDEHNPERDAAGKTIQELYTWWKARNVRPDPFSKITAHRDFDDMFDPTPAAVDEDGDPTLFTWVSPTGEYADQLAAASKEEAQFSAEDQVQLERLIKVRVYLWS